MVNLALEGVPLPASQPGELPVALHFDGSYDDVARELTVVQMNLSTPASQLSARGHVSHEGGAVQFSATTQQLSEWRGVFTDAGTAIAWPLEVKGQASLTGVLTGPLATPRLAGLQLADFATLADLNQWF